MRERVKQFEKDWRVKHTGTVEVPQALPDDSPQDACSSVDQADEMSVSTEAYENAKGGDQALTEDTTAEERKVESPSNGSKKVILTCELLWASLCDESSDDDNELVERRKSEQLNDVDSEVRDVKSELLHVRELLRVLHRNEVGDCGQTTGQDGAREG